MSVKRMPPDQIYQHLLALYPDAHCELVHQSAYELTVAVVLSAQTTDVAVNKITPDLFAEYPHVHDLAKADPKRVQELIKTIGLAKSKSLNLVALAKKVVKDYGGKIPSGFEDLLSLPGVGRKTANVIQSVWFDIPALAVDTHVNRVSKRLRLAYAKDSVDIVERKLKRLFKKEWWNKLHHLMIFFGRYQCRATKPLCLGCPFISFCREKNKNFQEKTLDH